jgi:hypothetical protein
MRYNNPRQQIDSNLVKDREMTEDLKRLGLRIDPELKNKLEKLAARDNRSLNQFIELLLAHSVRQIEMTDQAGGQASGAKFSAYSLLDEVK